MPVMFEILSAVALPGHEPKYTARVGNDILGAALLHSVQLLKRFAQVQSVLFKTCIQSDTSHSCDGHRL